MSATIRVERREILVIAPPPTPGRLSSAAAGPSPGPGYTNHIGSTRDGAGNTFWAITLGSAIVVMKRQQGSGVYTELHRFDDTKYGYGSMEVVGAHLVCVLAERQENGATVAVEYRLYDVAVGWPQSVA
jgi:hypothetical protein